MVLISLQDSYQDQLVLLNMRMYDKFYVPDVLIVLLYTSNKSNLYIN